MPTHQTPPNASEHLTEVELLDYFEGNLSGKKSKKVQQHLSSCFECFQFSVSYKSSEITEAEADNILRNLEHPVLDANQQLARLVAEGLVKPSEKRKDGSQTSAPDLLTRLSGFFAPVRAYGLQLASVVVILVVAAKFGVPQYFAWQSDSLYEESMLAMVEAFPISDPNAPRPAGDFKYGSFGTVRGENDRETQDKILADLERAIELNDKNGKAHAAYGLYYFKTKGEYVEARAIFMQGLQQDSTSADLLINLGFLAMEQEQEQEAENWFQRALHFSPDNEIAHYNLALLLQRQGKSEQAKTAWQKFLALANIDTTWQNRAKSHLNHLENAPR